MSFRPTVNLIMNGELLTNYYCKNYSEWGLLMAAAELIQECRGLNHPQEVKMKLQIQASEAELWDWINYSEFPVFVDLSARVVYHADRVLSAEELENKPLLNLVTIVTRKQCAKYYDESFFRDGIVPFGMIDLFEYLTNQDAGMIRRLLSVIRRDVFMTLYRVSMHQRSDPERTERTAVIEQVIDKLCLENDAGVLRLKADICFGSDYTFSWCFSDAMDCLQKLAGADYSSRSLLQLSEAQKDPIDLLKYAGDCLLGENNSAKSYARAMRIYETLYNEYSTRFQKYIEVFDDAVKTHRKQRYPRSESEPGLYSYMSFLLGNVFSNNEHLDDLNRYVPEKNSEADTYAWNASSIESVAKEPPFWLFEEPTFEENLELDWDLGNLIPDVSEEQDKKKICYSAALEYFLKARCACVEFFENNRITEEYLSVLDGRIREMRETLRYPEDCTEVEIDDMYKAFQLIRDEVESYQGTVQISVAPDNRCEMFVQVMKPGSRMRIRTIPEMSYCWIDSGLRLFADSLKYIAIRKKDSIWEFDSVKYREYQDENDVRRVLLGYYLHNEPVVKIDAALPLYLRKTHEEYQLKGPAADSAVLWMPIELADGDQNEYYQFSAAWEWAQEEIQNRKITVSKEQKDLIHTGAFSCADHDEKHYSLFVCPAERKALVRESVISAGQESVGYYEINNIYTSETGTDLPLTFLLNNALSLCIGGSSGGEILQRVPTEEEKQMLEPIENLGLSVRSFNCLRRRGIKTIGEICALTKEELLTIRNLGRKQLVELEYVMRNRKLPFAYHASDDQ